MQFPRIEIIKHRDFCGRNAMRNYMRTGIAYAETYEVQTMRPDRPMSRKSNLDRVSANSFAQKELQKLKAEKYSAIIYNGRIVKN